MNDGCALLCSALLYSTLLCSHMLCYVISFPVLLCSALLCSARMSSSLFCCFLFYFDKLCSAIFFLVLFCSAPLYLLHVYLQAQFSHFFTHLFMSFLPIEHCLRSQPFIQKKKEHSARRCLTRHAVMWQTPDAIALWRLSHLSVCRRHSAVSSVFSVVLWETLAK